MPELDGGLNLNEYSVTRTDFRDLEGGDRIGASYFVLDLTNDPLAWPAAERYAVGARRAGLRQLAQELWALIQKSKSRYREDHRPVADDA